MLALGSLPHSGLTVRDLDRFPEDDNRYEIIDGDLYVSPLPSYPHQQAVTELTRVLANHVRQHSLGQIFCAGLKVVLDERTGVGPDLVFISVARMTEMKRDGFYGPPDLAVEVLSSKPRLDRKIKFDKYAQAGVPHYWIIDPDKHILHAYMLESSTYQLHCEVTGNQNFEPILFPGLSIALGELWAREGL